MQSVSATQLFAKLAVPVPAKHVSDSLCTPASGAGHSEAPWMHTGPFGPWQQTAGPQPMPAHLVGVHGSEPQNPELEPPVFALPPAPELPAPPADEEAPPVSLSPEHALANANRDQTKGKAKLSFFIGTVLQGDRIYGTPWHKDSGCLP
jgi:hypothetical protein